MLECHCCFQPFSPLKHLEGIPDLKRLRKELNRLVRENFEWIL